MIKKPSLTRDSLKTKATYSQAFIIEFTKTSEDEFKHFMFNFPCSSSSSGFFTETMLRSDEFEFNFFMFDFPSSSSSSGFFTKTMLRSDEFEFNFFMFDFLGLSSSLGIFTKLMQSLSIFPSLGKVQNSTSFENEFKDFCFSSSSSSSNP